MTIDGEGISIKYRKNNININTSTKEDKRILFFILLIY